MSFRCVSLGLPVPSSTTLMASKTNPAREAWIIGSGCDPTKLLLDSLNTLDARGRDIEYVHSLPTETHGVLLQDNNPLKDGANFTSATKLNTITMSDISPALLNNVAFPSSLTELHIFDSQISSMAKVNYPPSLKTLWLQGTQFASLKDVKIPPGLITLVMANNKLTSIDAPLPNSLKMLQMNLNAITTFDSVSLPPSLESFVCMKCHTTVVRGIKWPKTLQDIALDDNPITAFEIRESDFERLSKTIYISSDSESCAKVATVEHSGNKVCIISDEKFEDLYVRSPISPPVSTPGGPPTTSGGTPVTPLGTPTTPQGTSATPGDTTKPPILESAGNSSGSLGATVASTSNSTTILTEKSTFSPVVPRDTSSSSRPVGDQVSNSSAPSHVNLPSSRTVPRARDTSTKVPSSSSASSSLVIVIAAVVGVLVVLSTAVFIYRSCIRPKRRKVKTNTYKAFVEGAASSTDRDESSNGVTVAATLSPASTATATNDIRFDPALAKFRIGQKEIHGEEPLARGGFGVIYRGKYGGRDVAIKQMLPDTWRDDALRASFMDEIRMCASLEHAKVVEFIGISWSSLRDLAVVIEFMAGGDLFTLLHAQRERSPAPSPLDWSQPWTPSQIKSKTSIALDVAEAVVYLHSYNSPILHRDLKAKNVLLDLEGNAKLSDFGISRELSVDETMTREIGTAAWIAPEVLRGERYSEKADIYSLGVLLVELDRCQHPYADELMLQRDRSTSQRPGAKVSGMGGRMSQISQKNTQIAVLVGSGKLKPRVSIDCPVAVASLVARCLQFDPADRPTAMQVFYEFRQLRKK